MAKLTAIFAMIDNMSAKLDAIAGSGSNMVSRLEQVEGAANNAFSAIDNGGTRAARSVDGVASSASSLRGSMDDAAEAIDSAADSTGAWTDSVDRYGREAMDAAQATEDLADSGRGAQNALEAEADAAQNAEDALDDLENQTEDTENAQDDMGSSGVDAINAIATTVAMTAIVSKIKDIAAAFLDAAHAAAEVETAYAKLQTIAGADSMGSLTTDIRALSAETGIAQESLADVAYNAISAGTAVEDAVSTASAASKLATAGFTETSAALSVLSTAMNSYGDSAGTAEEISNGLIMVQNLGVTTVADLAANMGRSISAAAAYNVSLSNLESAYVSVTKAGINTAEGTTYIAGMLNELGKEGSNVAEIVRTQTGQSFGELMNAGYSLADVLSILYDYAGNDAEAMMNLWGSQTAGMASAAIVNQGLETFNDNLLAIENSAGATEAAYSTMADTTAYAQERMQNAVQNLSVAFGSQLNPVLEKVYNLGSTAFNWMADFVNEHPAVTKAVTAIAVGLGVAAVAIVGVSVASLTAIPAVAALGTAISAAIWPITAIAAGVAALTAAVFFLIDAFEEDLGETEGMTAVTRDQYYALQDLNAEYEEACEKYGETSEEASRLKYQMDDLEASFEANRQTVEEFTAEIDALCESVHTVTEDYNTATAEIRNNEIGSMALIQKYEDLANKANRTAAEEQALAAVTRQLSSSYPELADSLANATGGTEDYVEALKRACEQEAEEQRQQQAQETYIEALKKREELTQALADAQENVNLEQARMDDMSGWTHFWTAGEWDDLEAYQAALDELNAAMAENDATIAEIEQGWEDLATAEEEAAQETITYEEAAAAAYASVQERVEELCEAYDAAYTAAKESFEGQFGLFDEAQADMDATVASAQNALDSQLAYWETYGANIETLKNTSAADLGITQENYEAIMAQVQDGSEQAAGLAASMVEAINSGDAEAVATLANTLGEIQAKQDEIAQATADWQTGFEEQMQGIVDDMAGYIDDLELSNEAAANALSTVNSYADSIRAGKTDAVAAAKEIADAVTATLSTANPTLRVQVASSSSVPGHAAGTTNAEDVFMAGEEGPELIVGMAGSTVFPTSETDRIINAVSNSDESSTITNSSDNRVTNYYLPEPDTGGGAGSGNVGSEEVKKISLEIGGGAPIEISGSGGVSQDEVVEILIANIRPALINIVKDEIFEEGDGSYEH